MLVARKTSLKFEIKTSRRPANSLLHVNLSQHATCYIRPHFPPSRKAHAPHIPQQPRDERERRKKNPYRSLYSVAQMLKWKRFHLPEDI